MIVDKLSPSYAYSLRAHTDDQVVRYLYSMENLAVQAHYRDLPNTSDIYIISLEDNSLYEWYPTIVNTLGVVDHEKLFIQPCCVLNSLVFW